MHDSNKIVYMYFTFFAILNLNNENQCSSWMLLKKIDLWRDNHAVIWDSNMLGWVKTNLASNISFGFSSITKSY